MKRISENLRRHRTTSLVFRL